MSLVLALLSRSGLEGVPAVDWHRARSGSETPPHPAGRVLRSALERLRSGLEDFPQSAGK